MALKQTKRVAIQAIKRVLVIPKGKLEFHKK